MFVHRNLKCQIFKTKITPINFILQPLDGVENFENTRGLFNGFIQNGEQLESKENIHWCMHLDRFIRYSARFTKFRHMKIKHAVDDFPDDYATFLISFICNTK